MNTASWFDELTMTGWCRICEGGVEEDYTNSPINFDTSVIATSSTAVVFTP